MNHAKTKTSTGRLAGAMLLLALLLLAAPLARAEVRLPAIFSEHMVLQRDMAVPVWGWAAPGEQVTVSIAGQTKTATTGEGGKWQVKLDPLPAGGPLTCTVKGKNTIEIADVLVGEAWLCSGQSNMALMVSAVNNAEQEAAAANDPQIRQFLVTRAGKDQPQAECQGSWQVCTPETVKRFTAAGYFFGRALRQALKVPVGLINSSVGGTPIEAWTSLEAQQAVPQLKPILEQPEQPAAPRKAAQTPRKKAGAQAPARSGKGAVRGKAGQGAASKKAARRATSRKAAAPVSKKPGVLYNGMISPLIPYAIRGAIWYQGENNANRPFAALYGLQLATLIKDWRTRWGQGDFPFAWVQLPNFNPPNKAASEGWPIVREQMLKTLKDVPNTGMAITIDIGDPANIHPKNKQEAGRRLALWALGTVYGQQVPSTSGPLPAGHEVQGGEVVVSFTHADGGLAVRGGGELRGFTIAGADRQFKPATARIQDGKVVVSSPEVKTPAAVRYDWANDPDGNLVNGAGLPASPFRTAQ